ncbi:diaminopimelate epimerase [Puteibacter caeruleilacunae]|nr:diaminopimelate epimerase [Puteibacter caeruleilacunae]
MRVHFYKYQGAGNDFVIIDNRDKLFDGNNVELIEKLCDRRFGIGGDGLMLLEEDESSDFLMRYFNADGREASMCGNGGRCIVAFAHRLGLFNQSTQFMAVDGLHDAIMCDDAIVDLKMIDVEDIEAGQGFYFMDTGSPHYVRIVNDISSIDVYNDGRAIRYNERFKEVGTNVNFVQIVDGALTVYTYERGVEDETLACGTGITASAIAAAIVEEKNEGTFPIKAKGGDLEVRFQKADEGFNNIWLKGPATFVFEGDIEV